MSTSTSKAAPSTPVQVPTSSRRRTPPLGRNLSKRTPPRHPKTIIASSPPSYSFPSTSPSSTPTTNYSIMKLDFGPPRVKDVFDMGEMTRAIEEVLLASGLVKLASKGAAHGEFKMRAKGKRKAGSDEVIRRPRVTGIQDLPDELLFKIFSGLHDQHGFRAHQTTNGPEWYNPPLRVALVCRRWLPLTRQLFYRTISIHHTGRISSLYKALSNPSFASLVRRISIKMPAAVVDSLNEVPDSLMRTREADDSGISNASLALSPKEMLRAILQSCPHLLRIDISGVAPSSLLPPSPARLAASLAHLHQLRFQSVTSLFLFSPVGGNAITATEVRAALLCLNGLRHLGITGYVHSATPLSLSLPNRTPTGLLARPLPIRARKLRLRSLRIINSSFDATDLAALISHISPGSLEELVVEEVHSPATGFAPTLVALPSLAPHLASIKILRVALYNYPSARPGTIDEILPQLRALETLDLGGNVCSEGVLGLLPPSVRVLRLRGTPALSAPVVRNFLAKLAAQKKSFGLAGGGGMRKRRGDSKRAEEWEECARLSRLEVLGGATSGWGESGKVWDVQRTCWDAGVVWRGW